MMEGTATPLSGHVTDTADYTLQADDVITTTPLSSLGEIEVSYSHASSGIIVRGCL